MSQWEKKMYVCDEIISIEWIFNNYVDIYECLLPLIVLKRWSSLQC